MTREEAAIKSCEDRIKHLKSAPTHHYGKRQRERAIELEKVKIKALRPVSREQVEKVWPGCEFCNRADFGEFGFEITKHYAKISCALGSWRFPKGEQFLFCPKCGKPLTDEAVEMVMERLEELKDAGD